LIDFIILIFANDIAIHGKNDFAEASKILARYRSENNLLDYQNYFVECLSNE